MKVKANLFIDNRGGIRVTKNSTGAYANELAVQLLVEVPDVFFNRPMPIVELDIPQEYLVNPDAEVVARWVAHDISEALKLEVKTVEDGLLTMLKNKEEEVKNNG